MVQDARSFFSTVIRITERRWKPNTSKNCVKKCLRGPIRDGRRSYAIKCDMFCSRVIGITEQRWRLDVMDNTCHVFQNAFKPNQTRFSYRLFVITNFRHNLLSRVATNLRRLERERSRDKMGKQNANEE